MVALVGGNSLGLNLTSLATLGQRGYWGQALQGRNGEAAYVNVANGNVVLQDRDDQLVGRGLGIASVRTYNSEGDFPNNNPDHWLLGAAPKTAKRSGGLNALGSYITRSDQDGSSSVYAFDPGRGLYVSTAGSGAYDTIQYDPASTNYVWTDGETGQTERYASSGSGALLSSVDSSGNSTSYAYNNNGTLALITDASGESVRFIYGAGQRVSEIRTQYQNGSSASTLTRVRYAYDSLNRLKTVTVDLSPEDNSVTDGKVYVTNYTYDGTSSRISSVTQSDATSIALTYVLVGLDYRVATFTDGMGKVTRFDYDTANGKTVVTDPLGLVTTYQYDSLGQIVRVTSPAVDGVSQVAQFSYDANGNVVLTTDPSGNKVAMTYDAHGNQTSQRDDLGNTVTRTFGASFDQLLTETVHVTPDPDGTGPAQPAQGLTTRYAYDAKNRLRFAVSPEGRVTEHRYATTGERTSSIEYAGALYDVSGLAATAAPSEAQLASWAAAQDKAKTQRIDMGYDFRGQLARTTTYAAVDSNGNGIADATQAQTTFLYNQAGQLLKTISGNGGQTGYTYDGLGRLITLTDANGVTTVTSYDDAHNATSVRQINGLTTTSTYDRAGRLVLVQQTDAAAAGLGRTSYQYDADGRLLMSTDPTGAHNVALYDAAGRKIADIDATGALTEYRYDQDNRLTCSVAYAAPVSMASLVDAAGRPLNPALSSIRPAAGADDRSHWWIYDAAGRLVKTVAPDGAVVENRYDGAGRVVSEVAYANRIDVSALAQTTITSAQATPAPAQGAQGDRVQRRFYDNDGLLRATLDAEGYLVEYRYDEAGRRVMQIGYASPTDLALRTSGTLAQLLTAVAAANDAHDIRAYTRYSARGQVAAQVDGEGFLTESVYDADGNLQRQVRYEKAIVYSATATLDALRQAATGSKDQAQSFTYTLLDQLKTQTDAEGVQTAYTYDNLGRLTQTSRAVATNEVRTVYRRYDLQGRLIGELSGEGSALLTGNQTSVEVDAIWAQYGTSYTYDAAGRRTAMVDANGYRTLYLYDADCAAALHGQRARRNPGARLQRARRSDVNDPARHARAGCPLRVSCRRSGECRHRVRARRAARRSA